MYFGPLNQRTMFRPALRGYTTYLGQLSRCRNPKNNRFKWYGAKGIIVEYGPREFIGWFLLELEKKQWKRPSVGRIDHLKNYSFDNIEMQELSDNSKERNIRCGFSMKTAKPVLVKQHGKTIAQCASISAAARQFNKNCAYVSRVCRGLRKPKPGSLEFCLEQ